MLSICLPLFTVPIYMLLWITIRNVKMMSTVSTCIYVCRLCNFLLFLTCHSFPPSLSFPADLNFITADDSSDLDSGRNRATAHSFSEPYFYPLSLPLSSSSPSTFTLPRLFLSLPLSLSLSSPSSFLSLSSHSPSPLPLPLPLSLLISLLPPTYTCTYLDPCTMLPVLIALLFQMYVATLYVQCALYAYMY